MKTLTFYSGKLWHSEKPFPALNVMADPEMKDLKVWLSTAYEVVNPDSIGCYLIEMKGHKFFYGPPTEGRQKQLSDGDQITLPEGYGIEVREEEYRKWTGDDEKFYDHFATITLPEKPSQYAINRKFDRLISSEIKSAMEKPDNSSHGSPKYYCGDCNVSIGGISSVCNYPECGGEPEPSESQEEMWAEFEKEFVQKSIIRMGIKQIIAELSQKFTITRK